MKAIAESSEVFEAYARIDYCTYELSKLQEEIKKPQNRITMMVDYAVGFNPIKESIKAAIGLTQEILRSKKIIEAETASTEASLKKLNNLLNTYR